MQSPNSAPAVNPVRASMSGHTDTDSVSSSHHCVPMSTTSETRTSFWREHFQSLAQAEPSSQQTDFSNQAIIVQNFAYMLEACGIVEGKRVLDAGFGGGELSRMMSLLGAEVTAFDVGGNKNRKT